MDAAVAPGQDVGVVGKLGAGVDRLPFAVVGNSVGVEFGNPEFAGLGLGGLLDPLLAEDRRDDYDAFLAAD